MGKFFFVKLNGTLKNKSQKQLNTFFGLHADNPIYVNGNILDSSNYYIATESISSVNIINPNRENKLKRKALHISLSSTDKLK